LQTKHVHEVHVEKSRIGGTVRCMATAAAFSLHRNMFVDEGPLLVDMALVADCVATGEGPHLTQSGCPMRIMAVIALHQPFIHSVVIRFGKVCLGRSMASVAQLRLALDQQVLLFLGMMRRVAIDTSNVTAGVGGLGEVRLLVTFAVAGQTPCAGLLPGSPFEHKYLGLVAAARYMVRTRAMAALAPLL
jgi:hypothetical protein